MEKVILKTVQGHTCEVYLHGAHVTSWKSPEGEDLLFLSKQALFQPPKAIRGGVPVCFPQFGMMGPMTQQHGFARNTSFVVEEQREWEVVLALKYDGASMPTFPHPFELRVRVALCDHDLVQEVTVKNTGSEALPFTTALHTYFRVASIDGVSIAGLQGGKYLDNLQQYKECQEAGETVTFGGEVDRVYLGAPDLLKITDTAGKRVFEVRKRGFPDAVVWNPWVDKARGMADFGDDEYKEMLCIEPAVAGSGAVTLPPGGTWTGAQKLTYGSL